MNQNYSDIVEQVSQILFQAIQERESFLCENVKQVDASLAKLLREAMEFSDEMRPIWIKHILDSIDSGYVKRVISRLKRWQVKGQKSVSNLSKYLLRFQDAVHYDRYRSMGLPIGSGEVESAHRYIPQKRLKIAGATWHPNTINPMLALRVIRANHWWADFWKQIVPETKINENTAFG